MRALRAVITVFKRFVRWVLAGEGLVAADDRIEEEFGARPSKAVLKAAAGLAGLIFVMWAVIRPVAKVG